MYSEVFSMTLLGMESVVVKVETDTGLGLPCFEMSGYLAAQVREAKERVRVAVRNSGIELKPQRIVVNISPADIRKAGTGFDLPIALGILAANKEVDEELLKETILIGELSLDGSINSINGVLSHVMAARNNGFKRIIIPAQNLAEGSIIGAYGIDSNIEVLGADNLSEVIEYFNGNDILKRTFFKAPEYSEEYDVDFADIIGQEVVKRATLIAVAGMHNIMYIGAPGSGKTMMAKRIPTIMPDLAIDEAIELTKIYSAAGKLAEGSILTKRPFKAPHHSITPAALLGGGRIPYPGEITLASKGVLFLDELTEFPTGVMEALRQPLEDRKICVCRLGSEYIYPADFMLVAAINPCKCGFYPDRNRCRCNEQEIDRYLGRISGPMWDRFDMNVLIEKVNIEQIVNRRGSDGESAAGFEGLSEFESSAEFEGVSEFESAAGFENAAKSQSAAESQNSVARRRMDSGIDSIIGSGIDTGINTGMNSRLDSATMKEMVFKARRIQEKRFEGIEINYNSQMNEGHIEKFCPLGKRETELMNNAYKRLGMTMRGYHKVIKTARTIADIEGEEDIGVRHLCEAISYKSYGGR